jgi:hypothetical protein
MLEKVPFFLDHQKKFRGGEFWKNVKMWKRSFATYYSWSTDNVRRRVGSEFVGRNYFCCSLCRSPRDSFASPSTGELFHFCVIAKIPPGWYFLARKYGNTTPFGPHPMVLPAWGWGVNSTRGGTSSWIFHQKLLRQNTGNTTKIPLVLRLQETISCVRAIQSRLIVHAADTTKKWQPTMASSESAAAQPQQDEQEEVTVHNGSFTSYSIQVCKEIV